MSDKNFPPRLYGTSPNYVGTAFRASGDTVEWISMEEHHKILADNEKRFDEFKIRFALRIIAENQFCVDGTPKHTDEVMQDIARFALREATK